MRCKTGSGDADVNGARMVMNGGATLKVRHRLVHSPQSLHCNPQYVRGIDEVLSMYFGNVDHGKRPVLVGCSVQQCWLNWDNGSSVTIEVYLCEHLLMLGLSHQQS